MNRLWEFYDNGEFNRDEAKDAYYDLMRYHHMPISGFARNRGVLGQ